MEQLPQQGEVQMDRLSFCHFVNNVLYVLYKRKIYTAKTKTARIHRHPSEVSPSVSRRSPGPSPAARFFGLSEVTVS